MGRDHLGRRFAGFVDGNHADDVAALGERHREGQRARREAATFSG